MTKSSAEVDVQDVAAEVDVQDVAIHRSHCKRSCNGTA